MRRRRVDLPEPFAPIRRVRDPLGNERSRFFKVGGRVLGSYEKDRSSTDIAFDSSWGGIVGRGLGRGASVVDAHMMMVYLSFLGFQRHTILVRCNKV